MNSSELRINNYVTIDNPKAWPELKDIPMRVTGIKLENDRQFRNSTGSIDLHYDHEWRDSYSQFDEFIKPIPLTEEWLLKLGCFPHNDSNGMQYFSKTYGSNGVAIIRFNSYYNKYCYELGVLHEKVMTNVHEFQNLFFAITSTELTIKS